MRDATETRTFKVRHHPDMRPDERLHWRLYTYGPGHWCVGSGHSGTFASEAEAEAYGRIWIETGKPPCEVSDELFHAAIERVGQSLDRSREWIEGKDSPTRTRRAA